MPDIGAAGVEKIYEIQLTSQERAQLDKTVEAVRATIEQVKL